MTNDITLYYNSLPNLFTCGKEEVEIRLKDNKNKIEASVNFGNLCCSYDQIPEITETMEVIFKNHCEKTEKLKIVY